MVRKKYTKRKRKSNKTRRKYNRRKKKRKKRKTKRVIKGGGKKFDELMAEIYLNRDLILGYHPKPLTDQEAHNLIVATEKNHYDSFPKNIGPNEDRIEKYMFAQGKWKKKGKKKYKVNNHNSKEFIPINFKYRSNSDSDNDSDNTTDSSGRSSAASLAGLGF